MTGTHLFTQFGKTSLEILYAPFLVCCSGLLRAGV